MLGPRYRGQRRVRRMKGVRQSTRLTKPGRHQLRPKSTSYSRGWDAGMLSSDARFYVLRYSRYSFTAEPRGHGNDRLSLVAFTLLKCQMRTLARHDVTLHCQHVCCLPLAATQRCGRAGLHRAGGRCSAAPPKMLLVGKRRGRDESEGDVCDEEQGRCVRLQLRTRHAEHGVKRSVSGRGVHMGDACVIE